MDSRDATEGQNDDDDDYADGGDKYDDKRYVTPPLTPFAQVYIKGKKGRETDRHAGYKRKVDLYNKKGVPENSSCAISGSRATSSRFHADRADQSPPIVS